jgi:hypothetical protein
LIWNKEELLHQWNQPTVIPIYKRSDENECSNYCSISLPSTSYKIISNILLFRLTPYADEITGDHQCVFQHNRSTNDQIFYIWLILEKNGSIMVQYIIYSEISRKPMIQSGGKYYTMISLSSEHPEN